MIQLRDVHKSFDVRDRRTRKKNRVDAVRGISLEVEPGEIYGLLGPNGAGKTTTLRMIAGLMKPDQGSIEVCGLDTRTHGEDVRGKLAYLATDMQVYERFTPREQLRLFGEMQGVEAATAERRGMHLLDRLGLTGFADVKMNTFSTGQKQKVNIARALLHDPKAVIFDEPTTGLDVLTAKTVLDLLEVMKKEGRAVIVCTHAMPMAEEICDRVGIIFDGKLHGDAPPKELLRKRNAHSLDEVFFQLAAESEAATA
ncbi:MAG TPA: ABC transporter ATP-binding protein [Holophagaceae bacterium]|nr:ABC transporter ATP-binding protein [Holophagaceae bacterium]